MSLSEHDEFVKEAAHAFLQVAEQCRDIPTGCEAFAWAIGAFISTSSKDPDKRLIVYDNFLRMLAMVMKRGD